jgi:hypothetical protein
MKLIKVVLCLFVFIGCSNPTSFEQSKIGVQFKVNLPLDENGFYHLQLNRTENQTLHRIDGRIAPPIQYKRFEWEANLTYDVWHYTVNTTNIRSYTNKHGVFSNMIGPVAEMKGDTMEVTVRWDSKAQLDSVHDFIPEQQKTFYIILQ